MSKRRKKDPFPSLPKEGAGPTRSWGRRGSSYEGKASASPKPAKKEGRILPMPRKCNK